MTKRISDSNLGQYPENQVYNDYVVQVVDGNTL